MIYAKFITTSDIGTAIKIEFLGQISGNDDERIESVMADAVSLITDYINQRFDAKSIFANIRAWSDSIDYKPALQLSYVDVFGTTQYYTPTHWYADSSQPNPLETGIVINRCWYQDKLYRTDEVVTAGAAPGEEGSIWVEDDYRDKKIIRFTIDIGLFLLSRRIDPRKISDIRKDLYNQAKEWLTDVRDRQITPTIANYFVPEKSVDNVLWGSNPQINHYY